MELEDSHFPISQHIRIRGQNGECRSTLYSFSRAPQPLNGQRRAFSTNSAGTTRRLHAEKSGSTPPPTTYKNALKTEAQRQRPIVGCGPAHTYLAAALTLTHLVSEV